MVDLKLKTNSTWNHSFNAVILDGKAKEMGASSFLLYATIKVHADFENGKSFPSVNRLCELTGLGRTQINTNLCTLEKYGLLRREKKGRSNEYVLIESFNCVNEEGKIEAVASFDYIPKGIQTARTELKNFLLTGKYDGTIINIKYFTLNVQNGGIQATGNNPTINNPDNMEKIQKSIENLSGDLKKSTQKLIETVNLSTKEEGKKA